MKVICEGPIATISFDDADAVVELLDRLLRGYGNAIRSEKEEKHVREVRDALYAITNDSDAIMLDTDYETMRQTCA